MLQIEQIKKQYITGDLVQTALDGVSLTLRDHEFVAILGPSGSGKTTLLNVIGGLDRYDSGNLIINGTSTRNYSDRDWDSYRNHTVGFVFQSYNLIPHQSILANVELALTISGISGAQRRKRATQALEAVGLGNQLHKKPNQISGGQMQRVAIARALVNNPDILLADEPTGALDSETSIQVMELLKEVARDRLVVMVTHNPELARDYATRIVRVQDGRILSDSSPYTPETSPEDAVHRNLGKASMSFLTALSLSFNNLRTKKWRMLLTSFAGSIGIIGIALILSLSTGFQQYVDQIQEDTLSNYPLTIQSETANMFAAMQSFGQAMAARKDGKAHTVYESPMMSQMFASMGSNDLGSFKAYLEDHVPETEDFCSSVHYGYSVKPHIFCTDPDGGIHQSNPSTFFTEFTGGMDLPAYMSSDIFQELPDDSATLRAQYEVVQGRWPQAYNELMIILTAPDQMSDYMAYCLGLRNPDTLQDMIQSMINGEAPEVAKENTMHWDYDQLMKTDLKLIQAPDRYSWNEEYRVWQDMTTDREFLNNLVQSGENLNIVGIACPRQGSSMMSECIAYPSALTRYVIDYASQTEIVRRQLADPETDVFTGNKFGDHAPSKLRFEDMVTVDTELLESAFGMTVSQDDILFSLKQQLENAAGSMEIDPGPAQKIYTEALDRMARSCLLEFLKARDDGTGEAEVRLTDAEALTDAYLSGEEADTILSDLSDRYQIPEETFRAITRTMLVSMAAGYVAADLADQALPELPSVPPDLTLPTLPPDLTLPALPPELTIPTLPEDMPLPSVPEDVTLPSIPEDTASTSIPEETSLPALPSVPDAEPAPACMSPAQPEPLCPVPGLLRSTVTAEKAHAYVDDFIACPAVTAAAKAVSMQMVKADAQRQMIDSIAEAGRTLMETLGDSFYVDTQAISDAFHFTMSEEELMRLITTLASGGGEATSAVNLRSLGYADPDTPSSISVYFSDFRSKEAFMHFIDDYNRSMELENRPEQVIHYTDFTAMMMNSVRTIIDSISYVLIAFVAVSLIVSSIMIGIITYISVMERTKEIGILRAIGASRHNISQVFNAETFIIGLCSGLLGIGVTLVLILPINRLIHTLTGNPGISARLPAESALILVILSMLLTILGGLIPSAKAARKDPVIALRSE